MPRTPHPLETKIGYRFKKLNLLESALTHSSVRSKGKLFERLEFLGDRVLGLVIADLLYHKFSAETEGDLAKRLAVLVCRDACIKIADTLDLRQFFQVVGNEIGPNSAMLADAVEAFIGAIYLDGGMAPCQHFIKKYWDELLNGDLTPPKDAKTSLQEWAQSQGKKIPTYALISTEGPDHGPTFVVSVHVEGLREANGKGASKRQAEQKAAQTLLEMIQK